MLCFCEVLQDYSGDILYNNQDFGRAIFVGIDVDLFYIQGQLQIYAFARGLFWPFDRTILNSKSTVCFWGVKREFDV